MTAVHAAPTMTPPARPRARPDAPVVTGAPSAPVPLRVVPSRRSPGPLPGAEPEEPVVGRLLVDASRSPLSPHLRGRRIAVSVDGRRCTCDWGRAIIDLPAGRHLVAIEVERGGGWGRASEAVPVAAGSTVPVYYRAPVLPGLAGTLGPAPRSGVRAGGALALGVAALVTVLAAVLVLVALIGVVVGSG